MAKTLKKKAPTRAKKKNGGTSYQPELNKMSALKKRGDSCNLTVPGDVPVNVFQNRLNAAMFRAEIKAPSRMKFVKRAHVLRGKDVVTVTLARK